MRLLAIETSGEACSAALFADGELLDARHETIGRGHAERLVPMIRELPDRGRADRILVSLGPGSFTGVRIGLAAARAFGLAWKAEVFGFPTLALVAAMARDEGTGDVGVCMNGGHGEWFVQQFDEAGAPCTPLASLRPEKAVEYLDAPLVVGNRAAEFCDLATRPVRAVPTIADARGVLAIPEKDHLADLAPIYGRAPDARAPQG